MLLCAVVGFCFIVSAAHINKRFICENENREIVGRLQFYSDGTFYVKYYNQEFTGTYEIDGTPYPGDTNRITYYVNGQVTYGTYLWAIQDGQRAFFENIEFKLSLR